MFKAGDKVYIQGHGKKVFTFISFNEMFNYATVADDKFMYSVLIHNLIKHKDVEKEKKQPFFSIKEGSIESAARFIVANNSYMHNRSVDYMIDSINRVIKDMVDKIKNGGEAWYCATAGYVVMIQQEDEDYYVVEVLCDPSVSQDREFVNVEEII